MSNVAIHRPHGNYWHSREKAFGDFQSNCPGPPYRSHPRQFSSSWETTSESKRRRPPDEGPHTAPNGMSMQCRKQIHHGKIPQLHPPSPEYPERRRNRRENSGPTIPIAMRVPHHRLHRHHPHPRQTILRKIGPQPNGHRPTPEIGNHRQTPSGKPHRNRHTINGRHRLRQAPRHGTHPINGRDGMQHQPRSGIREQGKEKEKARAFNHRHSPQLQIQAKEIKAKEQHPTRAREKEKDPVPQSSHHTQEDPQSVYVVNGQVDRSTTSTPGAQGRMEKRTNSREVDGMWEHPP